MSEEKQITNEVLAQKIDSLREIMELKFVQNNADHDAVKKHLTRLNGQVAKNTKFITQIKSYWVVIMFIISTPWIITVLAKVIE